MVLNGKECRGSIASKTSIVVNMKGIKAKYILVLSTH